MSTSTRSDESDPATDKVNEDCNQEVTTSTESGDIEFQPSFTGVMNAAAEQNLLSQMGFMPLSTPYTPSPSSMLKLRIEDQEDKDRQRKDLKRRGICLKCEIVQIYDVGKLRQGSFKPLTHANAYKGRCLVCNPKKRLKSSPADFCMPSGVAGDCSVSNHSKPRKMLSCCPMDHSERQITELNQHILDLIVDSGGSELMRQNAIEDEDEEEKDLDKYKLTRIGVGVHESQLQVIKTTMSSEGHFNVRCSAFRSLVFEFSDGSCTGKLFDMEGNELSLLEDANVNDRIGQLSWYNVQEYDFITHIAGSWASSSNHLFQHIALFMSSGQIFSFGDEESTGSGNFNVEIPHTREAMRNIFVVPAIGLPIIVRDVGRRLAPYQYKKCTSELHKILLEASCRSDFVQNQRKWAQIDEYLRLRRAHDELAVNQEAISKQGSFHWTPLHIACNAPAPTNIILSLYKIAPEARSLEDKYGLCPSIPRSVLDGL